jgi:hypothetical protein
VGVDLVKLWWRLVLRKEHIKAWASSDQAVAVQEAQIQSTVEE